MPLRLAHFGSPTYQSLAFANFSEAANFKAHAADSQLRATPWEDFSEIDLEWVQWCVTYDQGLSTWPGI